ncbi:hypothetical protein ACNKHP_21255 [Shigella boydii]
MVEDATAVTRMGPVASQEAMRCSVLTAVASGATGRHPFENPTALTTSSNTGNLLDPNGAVLCLDGEVDRAITARAHVAVGDVVIFVICVGVVMWRGSG